ncbi:partitioning defective 3 homolog isoform X1 [Tigriopus californicus]|uniref:partitioning defective 3 homolog isoform X1 n=2 Tax=Tigriopus californicus TaxID=6832 RepID=UPI0027D9FB7A|nr:partitioning defective 3 homolog isoform X1 [Tigriopus californicus]
MKLTISFNGTKIVVPCGDGNITVKEFTSLATTRYKRAIGKHYDDDYWVSISSLKSYEGGMLDSDDLICDVCDDREQLQAIFDEQHAMGGHGHLGDGMCSSDSDKEANTNSSASGSTVRLGYPTNNIYQELQVRRGSDPALNKVVINSPAGDRPQITHHHGTLPPLPYLYGSTNEPRSMTSEENYDSLPDSQTFDSKCSLHVLRRREPLGASANKPDKNKALEEFPNASNHHLASHPPTGGPDRDEGSLMSGGRGSHQSHTGYQKHQMARPSVEVIIANEIGPLGIHVVPCDDDGRLIVQGIEPGGRVDRDGRLAVGDEIVEINGYPLTTVSFNTAQEIFKEALFAKELRVQVIKGVSDVCALSDSENKENMDRNGKADAPPPPAGSKVTTAVQANNTRKIGKVLKITLTKGASGLGFSITTRDNAPGGQTPIYIKNIMPKGAAIEEGTLKPGDRLLEVNGTQVDGMSQSDVVALLRSAPMNAELQIIVSRHGTVSGEESQSGTMKLKPKTDPLPPIPVQEEPAGPTSNTLNPETLSRPRSTSPSNSTDNYESYDSENNFQFPWKQREILTFDIPVHDTERAGLGVSVKGKTSTNRDGSVTDLGIFVKSVIYGGAASRDGRLKTNDQLVNINGLSLLGKANPQAMETLRKAMHEEGPMPGIITLTVARRCESDDPDSKVPAEKVKDERRDSISSQVTSSSDDIVRQYNVSPPKFKMPSSQSHPTALSSQLKNTRNPVIDRLMGKESAGIVPNNMRNESYYMATHQDTWSNSMFQAQQQIRSGSKEAFDCPTVHQVGPESVMIEQDNNSTTENSSNKTRESLTSLLEGVPGFARDQPGRQSMSEKRHATLDAKSTDTYQKRKKMRDERIRQQLVTQEEQRLKWKKSASVESLHTIGQQYLSDEEREALKTLYVRANSVRVSRSRGCNESFRQAVDRSYEREPGHVANDDGEDFEIQDDDPKEQKKKNRNSRLLRNFGNIFRSSGSRKSDNRKSMPPNSDTFLAHTGPSTSSMPLSHSVPDYQSYNKSKSGGDLPQAPDFVRPYQNHMPPPPGPDNYDYLPSAMMRPGSRVGIADPGQLSATSDYDVIQRHLHRSSRHSNSKGYVGGSQFSNTDILWRREQIRSSNHNRSQSNPSRARPKSNFYEYDLWSAGSHQQLGSNYQQQPQQLQHPPQQPLYNAPIPPKKPTGRAIQNHFNYVATAMTANNPYFFNDNTYMMQPPQPYLHPHHPQSVMPSRAHMASHRYVSGSSGIPNRTHLPKMS